RALRANVRHRRGEQQLLSASGGGDVRSVEEAKPDRIPLRGQGQPVSDAHEKAQGPGGSAGSLLRARRASRKKAGARSLSAAPALAGQPISLGGVSSGASSGAQ